MTQSIGTLLALAALSASYPATAPTAPPNPASGAESAVLRVPARQMDIPFRLDEARRAEVRELSLYVSRDEGRSWTLAATARPDEEKFPFKAPKNGLYWFAVRVNHKDGGAEPAELSALQATLRVMVEAPSTHMPTPTPTPEAPPAGAAPKTTSEHLRRLEKRVDQLEKRVKELEAPRE